MMVQNDVKTLSSLCLRCIENLICHVSLKTSKLIIKLVPDVTEQDDELLDNNKQVVCIGTGYQKKCV